MLTVALVSVMFLAAAAHAARRPPLLPRCASVARYVTAYQQQTWRWQRLAGQPATPASRARPRSCQYQRWARDLWWQRKHAAHTAYVTIPPTRTWTIAVRLAQRVYPGTSSWLLYISDREGGWGPFVMNHQGSGAGGWMQFLSSTYYAYQDDARRSVRRRGFNVPPDVWAWTHPLGQALTAGYMRFTGRDGCHWCL